MTKYKTFTFTLTRIEYEFIMNHPAETISTIVRAGFDKEISNYDEEEYKRKLENFDRLLQQKTR